jgi:hypothetical protein
MLEGILIVVVSPILFIDDGAQLYFLVIFLCSTTLVFQ